MINKWEIKDNHMGNVHMDLFIKAIWDEENKIYYSQSNVRVWEDLTANSPLRARP